VVEELFKMRMKKKWFLIAGCILLLFGLYQVLTPLDPEQEKMLRSQVRDTVKEKFPEQVEKYSNTLGLFPYGGKQEGLREEQQRQPVVVLVHGLDDPGKVWQNLAPVLVNEGYSVWQLEYPNDQPIVESTSLFFEELKKLGLLGIDHLEIVAHSMGGLVSRELLTSREIDYSGLVQQQLVPRVERLIMVGTPNHGSQMARFRLFAEVRDHLDRVFKGQAHGLGFLFDGAGEAKIDLLPGGRFLTRLNSRPHPAGLEMFIIAGITAPWSETDIDHWLTTVNEKRGRDSSRELEQISSIMKSMANGLGDGLVTVESARLDNVPFVTVPGTHLSMIRNITMASDRVPPAVPIIVQLLNNEQGVSFSD
jgi:pimeloyl-ACP methyl ester carboxylesterase